MGKLIVITGPSGVGKSTILKDVFEQCDVVYSVSATTRKPRPGEVDGKDYYFVGRDEFQSMIDSDKMLEWAKVFDKFYGTPAQPVLEAVEQGKNVVLDIDVQGGISVYEKMPDATFVLIVPPSLEVLHERLTGRKTEAAEEVEKRFSKAADELQQARASGAYEFEVVNNDLAQAVREVVEIIQE